MYEKPDFAKRLLTSLVSGNKKDIEQAKATINTKKYIEFMPVNFMTATTLKDLLYKRPDSEEVLKRADIKLGANEVGIFISPAKLYLKEKKENEQQT